MSDTNNGQENITEEQTVTELPTVEQPAENAEEPQLPQGVKEQTAEEFEKLKAKNRELSEKLKAFDGGKPSPRSVLDELHPNITTVPMATVPIAGDQVIDQEGYVDATLLNSKLTKAGQNAEEARRIAQQTQSEIQNFQESIVVREVHKDFPEIDPNSDQFDPKFYDFVKNDLIGQMMGGKKEDLKLAAQKAREILGSKQPAQPRKENISTREQASAPTGTSKGTPPPQDQSDLVALTYKGDKDAIYKRLQASGN